MTEWRTQKYWRNRSVNERLTNTNIPKKYLKTTLDNYDNEHGSPDVLEYVDQWLINFKDNLNEGLGLYFCGGTGSGKTHVATALLKRVVATHPVCGFFITADHFVQAAYAQLDDDELPEMYGDPYMMTYIQDTYDVLVLDGLGIERQTEFTKKALTSMLNSRYENKLVTIITTDLTIDKVLSIYGKRIASILSEACLFIPFLGDDYRLRRAHGEG